MGSTATRFAVFGKATRAASARWAIGLPAAPICIATMVGAHMPASISLLRTMVSLSVTWSATTKSTTKRTATVTTMVTIIINLGIVAQKAQRTTRTSTLCANDNGEIS